LDVNSARSWFPSLYVKNWHPALKNVDSWDARPCSGRLHRLPAPASVVSQKFTAEKHDAIVVILHGKLIQQRQYGKIWQVRLYVRSLGVASVELFEVCRRFFQKPTNVWFQRNCSCFWENWQNALLSISHLHEGEKRFFRNQLPLCHVPAPIKHWQPGEFLMKFYNSTTWWNTGEIPTTLVNMAIILKERFCSLGYSCKTFVAIWTQHGLVMFDHNFESKRFVLRTSL